MPTLANELRNKLERVVIGARDAAEMGARAALEALAVHHHEPYPHMKPAQRELRNHLRARARQLGDRQDTSGRLAIDHVAGECAYEHWHRMLFARFLAENNLLIESEDNMAISLAEAEELAKEEGVDVWVYASRCAQRMLPQIFRPDDPLLQVSFAAEHMLKLEKLVASLPTVVFTASDALGWVYQYWQSRKKDEVNRSEVKIGADEIPAVTQLFTEPYMVEFLLHNTLGAWWAGRKLSPKDAAAAKSEEELRAKLALHGIVWEYLRFVRGADGEGGPWRPAAGTFDGWPKAAAELRVLDPCCGSGHFLVAALHHLVPIRMVEEGMATADAVDAVLRDNLHGLEIDERCCQIAAFALAFAAWTYPDGGGYRTLPDLHIASSGIGPSATKTQWLQLAEKTAARGNMPATRNLFGKQDSLLSNAVATSLGTLYDLFVRAPILGSLIDPRRIAKDLFASGYESLAPLLSEVLRAENDDDVRERAIAASGMAKAAALLAARYELVITNVPYRQTEDVAPQIVSLAADLYPDARSDLATIFFCRLESLTASGGMSAVVMPQGLLYKDYYARLRMRLFCQHTFHVIARLGASAFRGIGGEEVKVCLVIAERSGPTDESKLSQYFVTDGDAEEKQDRIKVAQAKLTRQCEALVSSKHVLVGEEHANLPLLEELAGYSNGIQTGDYVRFGRCVWELPSLTGGWSPELSTVQGSVLYGGRENCLLWQDGRGVLVDFIEAKVGVGRVKSWIRGLDCQTHRGVAISAMGELKATLYSGELFDDNTVVIVPCAEEDLAAVWCFCSDISYDRLVRKIDQSSKVRGALLRVPFDRTKWTAIAAGRYPNGLPEPESDDPTQWLFHGRPDGAQKGTELQVAVARLLGYRWPAELDDRMHLSERARALVKRCEELEKCADSDGIVCIPAIRGEDPAAERVVQVLEACSIVPEGELDEWLRNGFFEEHCRLFHDRPFVWHIWDGRKRDGFQALVNYHKLCEGGGKGRRLLESLTYAYLGEWINRQRDGVKRGEGGAEDRLAAAVELQHRLKAIIEGEPPFDIFVRWKALAAQPIGWEPDVNDGVRVNIRPFLASDLPGGRTGAGILRYKPNIKWTKDRGKEPHRLKSEFPWFWTWDEKTVDFMGTGKQPDGNRHNDCHYTTKAKQAARNVTGGND